MRREEPEVSEKGRYPVCEAARRLECSRKTLHKWARYFGIVPHYNEATGRNTFTGQQLIKLWRAIN